MELRPPVGVNLLLASAIDTDDGEAESAWQERKGSPALIAVVTGEKLHVRELLQAVAKEGETAEECC